MTVRMKYLLGYCAFAPYISIAMALYFGRNLTENDVWKLASYCYAVAVPLSLVFVLSPIFCKPRNEKLAGALYFIGAIAHVIPMVVIQFMAEPERQNYYFWYAPWMMLPGMMVSMAISGLTLLLVFDNRINKEEPAKT